MHKSETDWMHARGQPASARAWPAASGQLAGWRVNSGHRSRARDSYLRAENQIGAAPHAFSARRTLSSALERAHWPSAIRPAARWRLARRARWLAGRARASSQSQIYA